MTEVRGSNGGGEHEHSRRFREIAADVGLIVLIASGLGEFRSINGSDVMGLSNMAERIADELRQIAEAIHPEQKDEDDGGDEPDNVIPLQAARDD